jgi:hypothetical protein
LVRCQRLASLSRDGPDAIASHAEPGEVKADPREEVDVGQGGQP